MLHQALDLKIQRIGNMTTSQLLDSLALSIIPPFKETIVHPQATTDWTDV